MNIFVPILYGEVDFDAFGDFEDFVESVSYGVSKTCQVRGSSPCRGAKPLASVIYRRPFASLYGFCTTYGRSQVIDFLGVAHM
jgi:hypothetical protein